MTKLFCCFIIGLFLGFLAFIMVIFSFQKPYPLVKADAIIALTGGKYRIEEAYNLLQKGAGRKLLISGVYQSSTKQNLIRQIDAKGFMAKVDLGIDATNTLGNAIESAQWLKDHHFKTVYLVTSDYHMPRSFLEFTTLMPNFHFIPYPVSPKEPFHMSLFSKQYIHYITNRLKLFGLEYLKFIREKIRFLFFAPNSFLYNSL